MDDDSEVNVNILRSVIGSYLKKKEFVKKREDEVKEKLAHLEGRPPRRDESYEINIETTESIVRTTSQIPTDSYNNISPSFSQNDNYVQGSGELLFHSKYCAYKDSDKSINEIDSRELVGKYVSMPKKKHTGKSKFSYKNYDKRNDMELDSDSEEPQNVNVSPRKHPKKRVNANAEQRETREVDRKHDKHSKRTREPLERVSVSDMSSSQVNLNTEPASDGHRYKKMNATLCKSPENTQMEYAAERLARIGLMRVPNDRKSSEHPGNEKHMDTRGSYLGYEEDERRDSAKYSKQGKSSRKTSNRETDVVSRYPKLMGMLGCGPGDTTIAPERKHKKSHTSNRQSVSRKDQLHDFERNRDHAISLRRPIQNPSSASESGSMSQCETTDKPVALRQIDSCRSSEEEHVRSRSPYGYSERRPRALSPAKLAPTTSGYAGPPSERLDENDYVARGSTRAYSREDRDERPRSQSHSRNSPAHDEGYRGSHRSTEERSRPHSATERVNESGLVGGGAALQYSREDRDERPRSQSPSRGSPASRPPVHDEGYRGSHRSTEERSRPHSATERVNESGWVGGGAALQYSREDRDERPRSQSPSRGSPASRPPVHDEGYRGSHRSTEERSRPHSATERVNESGWVGGGAALQYSREDRDERPRSQSPSRGSPASRPPVHDEGYRDTHRSIGQRSRSHSPAERLGDGGSVGRVAVTPHYDERKTERYSSPSRDQNQLVYNTPVDNDANNSNNFDETYSDNFLTFLIQKSLPRAMSLIELASNECNNKPSQEILNSVHEIATIKKLICDELDRRELMGRPFKLRRREKQRLINYFLRAKKINDRVEHGFSVHEALSNIPTKSSESSIRLHTRTIQAIRQANQILGGDLPDPAGADDLEKAAEECLRNLGKLHMETVSNYRYQGPTSQGRRTSPYSKIPDLPGKEETCKSCREDWFANEVNRLKDVILNIEQQMNSQSAERAVISRQINEVKHLTSNRNEQVYNFPATCSYVQEKRFNDTGNMPNARSFNPINNAYPVHKTGNPSGNMPNARPFNPINNAYPVHKTGNPSGNMPNARSFNPINNAYPIHKTGNPSYSNAPTGPVHQNSKQVRQR